MLGVGRESQPEPDKRCHYGQDHERYFPEPRREADHPYSPRGTDHGRAHRLRSGQRSGHYQASEDERAFDRARYHRPFGGTLQYLRGCGREHSSGCCPPKLPHYGGRVRDQVLRGGARPDLDRPSGRCGGFHRSSSRGAGSWEGGDREGEREDGDGGREGQVSPP